MKLGLQQQFFKNEKQTQDKHRYILVNCYPFEVPSICKWFFLAGIVRNTRAGGSYPSLLTWYSHNDTIHNKYYSHSKYYSLRSFCWFIVNIFSLAPLVGTWKNFIIFDCNIIKLLKTLFLCTLLVQQNNKIEEKDLVNWWFKTEVRQNVCLESWWRNASYYTCAIYPVK